MKRILIIDDDIQIVRMLREILTKEGYCVREAYSGTEALLILEKERPDLAVLDLMLPGLSGREVLAGIRGIPVIILSARVDVQDKVKLLLEGAADYMTKPFDTRELLARIAVQLRRQTEGNLGPVFSWGELYLDTVSHEVTVKNSPVFLTKTEYAIFKLLLSHPGQVIAKSVILEKISVDTPDCTERSLKQHISNLRKKLFEAGGREYIESVWGIGFKLAEKID